MILFERARIAISDFWLWHKALFISIIVVASLLLGAGVFFLVTGGKDEPEQVTVSDRCTAGLDTFMGFKGLAAARPELERLRDACGGSAKLERVLPQALLTERVPSGRPAAPECTAAATAAQDGSWRFGTLEEMTPADMIALDALNTPMITACDTETITSVLGVQVKMLLGQPQAK